MTGIIIVNRTVKPMTIHKLAVPGMPFGCGSGLGRAVWQEVVGKETEQGAVVVCIEQVL